ncbi:MAG TPA: two-component regulator propeller domain-containing protein, partial [Chitinophagaceae bacterium]
EDSILWVAADAMGLLAFNMQTGKFTPYSVAEENSRHGIAGHGFSFCHAKDEGLWIGGSKGLYRYDRHHQLFRNISLDLKPGKHCLNEVLTAYADPLDTSGKTVLVSTWSCGSYTVNLRDGSVEELPAWMIKPVKPGSLVTCFYRDKDGTLWMATSTNLLVKVNEHTRTVHAFEPPTSEDYIPGHYIKHLLDDGNGRLLLGTRHGLFWISKTEKRFGTIFRYGTNHPKMSTPTSDEIQALTMDINRNIWFCTNLRGDEQPVVGKIPTGKLDPVLYYYQPGVAGSFPEASPLQGITTDNKGNIWCASWNGMVYWNANEDTPVFKRLTRKDGLCNDKIFKLHSDKNGNIWIATLRGISCYDPASATFRNYYTAQGLHQDEVSNFFRNDVTGELIAGFPGSIDILDPSLVNRKKEAPTVVITGLRVLNEIYADNKKSYVNKGLVLLSPGQNMITISFSALSFTDPHEVKYAYRMEGVDKDWIATGNDFVTYHNLPPGTRRFYVRARNAEGIWSKEDTWLEIDIAPPFYRTWWFIALSAVVAGSIIYWLYRQRIRRLEEKFRIRSTIARDLHDEIGSTLTSINILSRVSRSNLHKDKERAEGLLQKITEQSQDMQQSMSDIIWAIKPDNDKLENMAAHMREYLSHTLEAKNIAIHFEADEQALKTSLNMEQRRDFFLIFKEAVNNAAKYAGSNVVTIYLKKEKRSIILVVSDTGIGFDVTKKHSSNGLKNMQARAKSLKAVLTITSAPGRGTSVELNIPTT